MMNKRIRIGVIGCGQFMSRQHIQTITRSEMLLLQHLADRDAETLTRVAKRYNPVQTSTHWEKVIVDPKVDVVVVGIVPKFHPIIVKAALENGKPVYVEKPLIETLREGIEIYRQAQERGISVAIGFNRRFAPATRLLEKAFATTQGPVSIFYRISDDDRVRPPKQKWKKGDQLLIETVHFFDLLAYLIRREPLKIYAVETRFNDTFVIINFEGGSHATIFSSAYGSLAQPKEHLEAILNHTAIEMDDFVEVRTYGLAGFPEKMCFAGRPYDDCNNNHVKDFEQRGIVAYLELRKRYALAMEESGVLANSADHVVWKRLKELVGTPPLPQINYCADKGWGVALEIFCTSVMQDKKPPNATIIDANRATACALAARQSINERQPVDLDPQQWKC